MVVGELGHGGALAAGDDERVDTEELLRLAHLHAPHPDPPQRCIYPPTHTYTHTSEINNTSICHPVGSRGRRNRIPYRPCARCRSPAARGRPPPPLPSSRPCYPDLGTRVPVDGWVGEREARRLVEWSGVVGDVTGSGMEGEEEAARRRGGGGGQTHHSGDIETSRCTCRCHTRRGKKLLEVGDGRSWPSDRRGAVRPRRRGDRCRPFTWGPSSSGGGLVVKPAGVND